MLDKYTVKFCIIPSIEKLINILIQVQVCDTSFSEKHDVTDIMAVKRKYRDRDATHSTHYTKKNH